MFLLIAKAIFFFTVILIVSSVVFTTLASLVGKFFNVTVAPDSVLATIAAKLHGN